MEHLHNGYTLELSEGAFPLGTDSVLLAGFVKPQKGATVLDLGSGCGTLGLMLCASNPSCTVTGIELDPDAHAIALENSRRNGLSSRLSSICSDFRSIHGLVAPGSFSCCVSNPPYFSSGPAGSKCPTARREDHCPPEALFCAASWALRYGGDFYLVHRPERLAQLCTLASEAGLEPKRLCLVRHRPSGSVNLILLQCRKGGKPGLAWEELCLHDETGQPTEEYRRIYHI